MSTNRSLEHLRYLELPPLQIKAEIDAGAAEVIRRLRLEPYKAPFAFITPNTPEPDPFLCYLSEKRGVKIYKPMFDRFGYPYEWEVADKNNLVRNERGGFELEVRVINRSPIPESSQFAYQQTTLTASLSLELPPTQTLAMIYLTARVEGRDINDQSIIERFARFRLTGNLIEPPV